MISRMGTLARPELTDGQECPSYSEDVFMSEPETKGDMTATDGPHFTLPPETQDVAAWEEVEEGRFMPRRVRGSYQGRALG